MMAATRIAQHVDGGAAHVQILAVRTEQQPEGGDVDQESGDRHAHHDAAINMGRAHQAHDRLVDDPSGDGEQCQAVGEGHQDLKAVEAVSAFPIGGPARKPESEPGQRQRRKVGEHVARIGDQRQRVRDDAAHHLDQHEAAGEKRGKPHAPLVRGVDVAGTVIV